MTEENVIRYHSSSELSLASDSILFEKQAFRIEEGRICAPASATVTEVATFLAALGLEPGDILAMSPSLATPCRLIRFDTHGTIFVIEERMPELTALMRQLQFESAVHKQGYAVERI